MELEGPLDLAASLSGFSRWGDDAIDRWDGQVLVRTAREGARAVPYVGTVEGSVTAPALSLALNAEADRPLVERWVREGFVKVASELQALAALDPVVGRLVTLYPGVQPVLHLDPLTALVRSISAQQVNLRWAATVRRRLAERYGVRHEVAEREVFSLHAEPLEAASIEDLRALQLTTAKSKSVIAVARAVVEGRLERDELGAMEDEAVIERLVELPGIGRWTAEWFLARTLGRPRAVAGDLGVRKAVGAAYLGGRLPSEAEVRELTAHWAAAAGVAQQLLLHGLAEGGFAGPARADGRCVPAIGAGPSSPPGGGRYAAKGQ